MRPTTPSDVMTSSGQELKWSLAESGGAWRFAIELPAMPGIDLRPDAVRVEPAGASAVVLPVPPEAQPVDLTVASCKFSRKRGELVVTWPRAAPGEWPIKSEQVKVDSNAEQYAGPKASLPILSKASMESVCHSPEALVPVESAESEVSTETPTERAASLSDEEEPCADEKRTSLCSDAPDSSSSETTAEVDASEEKQEEGNGSTEVGARNGTEVFATSPSVDELKALGNKAVKAGDYEAALRHYSAGLKTDSDHAILLSNRALCLHRLDRLEEALEDAKRCAELRPDFVKGFLRGAMVLRELSRPQEALEMLRRAPPNDEVEKLSAQVRPESEAAEKARIASLGGAERKKEEGNALFKKGLFEQALDVYNDALGLCSDPQGDLALAIRSNRAGCYHQLSNFGAVVEDTNFVLKQQPDNLKALIRRMIALEPLEKYEAAIEDARTVLSYAPGNEAANRVQHRLSKLVRDKMRQSN